MPIASNKTVTIQYHRLPALRVSQRNAAHMDGLRRPAACARGIAAWLGPAAGLAAGLIAGLVAGFTAFACVIVLTPSP